jgi:Ca-activated chloride channel family protein
MHIDYIKLLLFLLTFIAVVYIALKKKKPTLPFSQGAIGLDVGRSYRVYFVSITQILFYLALFFLGLAWVNPSISQGRSTSIAKIPRSGTAIYFLVDQSGSMKEESVETGVTKEAFVKEIIQKCVEERTQDLLGLVGFARTAHELCSLTLDHDAFLKQVKALQVVQGDIYDGTAIGYAIFKTIQMMVETKQFAEKQKMQAKPSYEIKKQVIVVLTDGLQSPNPLDVNNRYRFMPPASAIDLAQSNDISVYYIGVDPVLSQARFRHEIDLMREETQKTGGDVFVMAGGDTLQNVYDAIKRIPTVPYEEERSVIDEGAIPIYRECIVIALICLFLAVILDVTIARSVP